MRLSILFCCLLFAVVQSSSPSSANSFRNETLFDDQQNAQMFHKLFLETFSTLGNSTKTTHGSKPPTYFQFFPPMVARIADKETIKIEDKDFVFEFTPQLNEKDRTVVLSYSAKRKSLLSSTLYLFFLSERIVPHEFILGGKHTIKFKRLSDSEIADYKTNGLRVFHNDKTLIEIVRDFARTISMFFTFFSNKLMFISESDNVKFLKEVSGYTLEKRKITEVPITAADVHSGDVFGSLKLDGIDPLITAVTGSRIGHIQIALEVNGTMQICEAQDAGYWPVHGWQCNPFDKFIKYTKDALFNTVHLRLASPYREKFDAKKAWEFLQPHIGNVYGYEIFIFSALDTANENLFYPLDEGSLDIIYYLIDLVSSSASDLVAGRGLRQRLNIPQTTKVSRAELYKIIAERGKRLSDIYTMPEQDSFRYGEDGHISRVCSCFGTEILRASGAFEGTDFDVPFQAAEQSPADVIAFKLWDLESPLPEKCVQQDPTLPYCQIWGDYRIDLGATVNYKTPHAGMNEQCPSKAPNFERPAVC